MTTRKTPGRRLVALLDEGLPKGIEWTANERATLRLIEQAADRIEMLQMLLVVEVAKPQVMAHRVCELSGEIRQSENAIAKLISTLDPEMTVQAKSVRHQNAAYARWNGVGVGGSA
jgi:hypothetical protein